MKIGRLTKNLIPHQYSRELRSFSSTPQNFTKLPDVVRTVIAGSGVVANSVAYNLVKNGWSDILVLEQNTIGSGTSNFGSGTLGLLKPIADRNLIWASIKLYQDLQNQGYDLELKQCGSVYLAQTKDRYIALKRRMAYNIPTGLHCEIISKSHLKHLHPYLKIDDIKAAVWVPEDATCNAEKVTQTLARLSQKNGAKYVEHCRVDKVLTANNRVYAVQTELGTVKCEYFINCTGMWARQLGLNCSPSVRIPAYPAEQLFALSEKLPKDHQRVLPCVRDYDSHMYSRELNGELLFGWFEPDARPAFGDKPVPRNWKHHLDTSDHHLSPLWEKATHRFPILKQCPRYTLIHSLDNFTPDGRWILGETAEVSNYFVACGLNGNAVQGAGGIGKALAEWIIEGNPTQELLPFNVQRFLDLHNNRQYLQQRVKEVVGRHYSILYPHQCEYKYARRLRCSPLYSALESRKAVFGTKMAYERALYFDTNHKIPHKYPTMPPGSFYKPKFFDFMKQEHLACRTGVGIIDMTSFSKIQVKSNSNESLPYLQHLCSNDVNMPIGDIVHSGMQNERGGYENDCMIARQDDNSFFVVSPSSQQTRVFEWMSKHLPHRSSISLKDVTSMYTVLNVVGPKATALLNELSNSRFALGHLRYKKCNIGYASDVMVMSFTHTGEPGYCLYVPSEYALHVYDRLMTVGADYGVRDVGTLAQRWMRIEKFIAFWGEELTSFVTPIEAGHSYSVRFDKENFIGKQALLKQKDEGVSKRLVLFHVNDIDPDHDIWPWGGEPIYRNNEFVGTITSTGYGFLNDHIVCFGFICRPPERGGVTTDFIIKENALYEIDVAGKRFHLIPHIHAPHRSVPAKKTYTPTLVQYKSGIILRN